MLSIGLPVGVTVLKARQGRQTWTNPKVRLLDFLKMCIIGSPGPLPGNNRSRFAASTPKAQNRRPLSAAGSGDEKQGR